VHVIDHFRAVGRRPTSLSGRIECDVPGRSLAAELVNLGIGGACAVVRSELKSDLVTQLRIEAPQLWEPLIIRASVAWSQHESDGVTRLGLRFEPETATTLAVLAELVGYNGYL
jgi:hypothetical protein